ncbi:hypothetical protein B0H13DRAFT_1865749 [Mycena leptocephala]|nr:hypothetical protein B0H13DRAFT_1865749 [Mycena leptocephala]
MQLSDVLLVAGITLAEQHQAWHNSATTLWEMFQNHRAMSGILGVLGLASDQEAFCFHYKGGLSLTTQQVVSHLGWNSRTFVRKTKSFSRARSIVAQYTWQSRVPRLNPPEAQLAVRKDFEAWNGLVMMFCEGGFCERPDPPQKTSRRRIRKACCQIIPKLGLRHQQALRPAAPRSHPSRVPHSRSPVPFNSHSVSAF